MIKNTITLGLASLLVSASLYASEKKPNFSIHELINFPHPLQAIMQNKTSIKKMKLDDNQIKLINNKMLIVYPPIIQGLMYEAEQLEEKIKKNVLMKDMAPNEVKSDVDKLVALKTKVVNKHIESLNVLATILTPQQYKRGLEMFRVMKINKMYNKLKKQLGK